MSCIVAVHQFVFGCSNKRHMVAQSLCQGRGLHYVSVCVWGVYTARYSGVLFQVPHDIAHALPKDCILHAMQMLLLPMLSDRMCSVSHLRIHIPKVSSNSNTQPRAAFSLLQKAHNSAPPHLVYRVQLLDCFCNCIDVTLGATCSTQHQQQQQQQGQSVFDQPAPPWSRSSIGYCVETRSSGSQGRVLCSSSITLCLTRKIGAGSSQVASLQHIAPFSSPQLSHTS